MFKIFRLPMYYPRAVRGIHIAFTLLRFVIVNWLASYTFTFRFVPKRYKRNEVVQTLPERLRTLIEELGPTYIKFGQILADRPDIISDRLRVELKKLQSKAEPFDDEIAIELIEEELGGKIEDFFESFDKKNIASASIGQVYKGTLKTGEPVIIKIQRPNIEGKIKLDLSILKYFAGQLVKEFPGLQIVDIIGVVEEFGHTLMLELDYLNEAGNATRFAAMFKDVPYCKIPKVYLRFCTAKLLILEDVTGINPDNVQLLRAEGYDPKQIAENGTRIVLEMIFKHGFFHADPHAGNIFILPGNTVALIDFGMAGTLKPAHMHFLAGFTLGMSDMNAEIITDSLLTLCGKKFFAEKADLEFAIQDMLSRYASLNYNKIDFSHVLNESVKIILNYKLKIPASIYLLLKALASIEKFGYNLDPDISLPALVKPYAVDLIKQKMSPKHIATDIYETVKDYLSLMRDFPGEVNEILYHLKTGKIVFDIQVSDKELFTKSLKSIGGVLSITILVGFMLAGSIAMNIWGHESRTADIMFGVSVFFAAWLLIRLFFRMRV
jgi:ubiquinone biosynthesis protein